MYEYQGRTITKAQMVELFKALPAMKEILGRYKVKDFSQCGYSDCAFCTLTGFNDTSTCSEEACNKCPWGILYAPRNGWAPCEKWRGRFTFGVCGSPNWENMWELHPDILSARIIMLESWIEFTEGVAKAEGKQTYSNAMNCEGRDHGITYRHSLEHCCGCGNSQYPDEVGMYIDGWGTRIPLCQFCGHVMELQRSDAQFFPDYFANYDELEWCDECDCLILRDEEWQFREFGGYIYCHRCVRKGGVKSGIVGHINVYLEDRACGGPEEGGWYYNYGHVILSIPLTESMDINAICADLEKEYTNEGRPSINSVLSEGRFRIEYELLKGQDWPEKTPRYE